MPVNRKMKSGMTIKSRIAPIIISFRIIISPL